MSALEVIARPVQSAEVRRVACAGTGGITDCRPSPFLCGKVPTGADRTQPGSAEGSGLEGVGGLPPEGRSPSRWRECRRLRLREKPVRTVHRRGVASPVFRARGGAQAPQGVGDLSPEGGCPPSPHVLTWACREL